MTGIYQKILSAAESGAAVVMATVIKTCGSVPRKCGTKMLVFPDGSTEETVGGGAVEADVIACAQDIFKTRSSVIKQYSFEPDKSDNLNLICGGEMEILIEYIGSAENLKFYADICKNMQNGRKTTVSKKIITENQRVSTVCYFTDEPDSVSGTDLFSYADSTLTEVITPHRSVFIIGAGHVARETAHFAKRVGFFVTVMDDRAEYADALYFPDADRLLTVADYNSLFEQENINNYSYIVIATRGHEHDMEALKSALFTDACYIGMMGSRKKKAAVYGRLLDSGFSEKDLNRISSPIGIDIGAETPAEIALSIVSEMVRHRSEK